MNRVITDRDRSDCCLHFQSQPAKFVVNPSLSAFLNFSRWFAALLVLVGHCRHLILVDLKAVDQPTLFVKGVYFFTGLVPESVGVFFVISGLLVGGPTLTRWQQSGIDPGNYAIARISRIYTVLIPALIIGGGLDLIGLTWFNASEGYTLPEKYHTISLEVSPSGALSIANFVGCLAMLNGWLTGYLGSNSPLWSLAYECWYYILFALFAAGLMGKSRRTLWMLFGFAVLVVIPFSMALWGAIWLLGVLTHYWMLSNKWRPHPALGLLMLLIAVTVSRLSHNVDNAAHHEALRTEFLRDVFLGLAYVVALVSATRLRHFSFPGVHRWAADFSFTTYLMHFPVMMLLTAIGYQLFGLKIQIQPSVLGLLQLLGVIILVCVFCFVMSLVAERHTVRVRNAITSYVSKRFAPQRQVVE